MSYSEGNRNPILLFKGNCSNFNESRTVFSFMLANLIIDLLYGWLDPRVRYD